MAFGKLARPRPGRKIATAASNCAGTNLDGNYPNNTDSRLISPSIQLPAVSGDEEIHLRFWHWFSYRDDQGYIQVSTYDESTGEWSSWETIGGTVNSSSDWALSARELTNYAGQKVRIAFYHTADSYDTASGWYIDDIEIIKKAPVFTGTEDFEPGWGDWSTDNGVWQVGTPTAGPEYCHSGVNCAGTNLDGNYPNNTDSRLISPSIQLPAVSGDEEIHLRFWHWFSYRDDQGLYPGLHL